MKKGSYWKQRPSEKGSYIMDTVINLTDKGLSLAFDNKFVHSIYIKIDSFINKIDSLPAPQWMYDLEKSSEPIKPIEVKFEDSFRGEIERYVLASTQVEQTEAVKKIKGRENWIV